MNSANQHHLDQEPQPGWRVFWPTCRDASRLQSDALDRRLGWLSRTGLLLHLAFCSWCRRYGRQLRFLRKVAQEHPVQVTEAEPSRLSDCARDRLRQSLMASMANCGNDLNKNNRSKHED